MVRLKNKKFYLLWTVLSLWLLSASTLSAATITGVVTNQDNEPVSQCSLALYTSNPGNHHDGPVRNSVTNNTGSFTLDNIQVGEYYLYANAPGYWLGFYAMEGTGEIRVVAVDADDQEVVGVDIQLFVHNDPPPPPPNSGDISGNVYSNGTVPVPHALVGVCTLGNPQFPLPGIYARASYQGHYFLHHVPAGEYTTCVINEYNMQAVAWSAPVIVVDQGNLQNVNINFNAGASFSLSGTVRNSNSQPLHYGVVELRSVADGSPGYMHIHRTGLLNFEGQYLFENVPDGQYIISVWSYSSPMVYYPSTYDQQEAVPVVLEGGNQTNIDITVPLNMMFSISGQVLDADSHLPLEGITVKTDRMGFHHFPMQDSLFTDEYFAVTDANGEYTLSAPLGRYTVVANDSTDTFFQQFYNHTANPYEANIIWLDHNITNVNFDLTEIPVANTGSIAGAVYDNGETPTYPVMVVAVSSDEDWEDSALVGMDGTYQINSLPPGTYYLIAFSLYSPPSYYDSVLTWEDAEQVTVNGAISGIDFNLTYEELDGPSSLAGRIEDGSGNPFANVTVALKNVNNQVVGFARTNENGDYYIYNVPSQDYTVVATKLGLHSTSEAINLDGTLDHDIYMTTTAGEDHNNTEVAAPRIDIYPNPFNPRATIALDLPKTTHLTVRIYNLKGQCIKTLADQVTNKGSVNLNWNGLDTNGNSVANGIYLIKIKTDDSQSSRKLTLLK